MSGSSIRGMRLFVASDALTFLALFVVCGLLRAESSAWPRPFPLFPVVANAALMTGVLAASSYTMLRASRAAAAAHTAGAIRWLILTAGAGILFVALHLREWHTLWHGEGLTPSANPWGDPLFGAVFYGLTGLHVLHIAGGIVALAAVAVRLNAGRAKADSVAATGLYWHFVDAVWLALFAFIYLAGVRP